MADPDTETERRRAQPETPPPTTADTSTETAAGHGTIPSTSGPSASERGFGPEAGGPEIEATPEALGEHTAEGMKKANVEPGSGGQNDVNHGIHYWYNYQRQCEWAGHPEMWKDEYRHGHTQAKQFVNPHENGTFMDWELKKGQSASQAIKDWLAGATVAECLSTVIALEIDTLRASIGDRKFDKMFGSADPKEDAAVSAGHRMHVRAGISGTPVANYMKSTKIAEDAQAKGGEFGSVEPAELDKDLIPGQWYYFYNHPKYLLKHPGGAWQGENALYMGKNDAGERLWSGLGATATEDAMTDEMVRAYNQPRNDYDHRVLKEGGQEGADGKYTDPLYDPAANSFPDTVTKQEILASQPYQLGGYTRKGGFMATAGRELDAKKVEDTREHD
jgi:Protein-glutamine gamma-glutamyltransferase